MSLWLFTCISYYTMQDSTCLSPHPSPLLPCWKSGNKPQIEESPDAAIDTKEVDRKLQTSTFRYGGGEEFIVRYIEI